MAFITKAEMKTVIRENHLDSIVDDDDTIVLMAINAAISEVKSRLTPGNTKEWFDGRPRYDADAIFNATGTARHPLILEITKVVALWWLIIRANAGVHYEEARQRYDRGMAFIKELATGEANDATLPRETTDPVEDDPDLMPFRMGSRTKFHHE